MSQARRVKILETDYNEELNLVQWKVQDLETNNIIDMAWRGKDLGIALGITQEIPPELMKKFCNDIIGKIINLVMNSEADKYNYNKLKDLDEDTRNKTIEEWEKNYPFFELEYLEKMKMEKEKNDNES